MTANASQDIRPEMPRAYDASAVEQRIYQTWLSKGYFTPSPDPKKQPFVIIMPPPNVTGELHLGHALTASLEDALIRWHRMLGDAALWLPGKDHAGIATQWVVERLLASEGLTRQELGREKFLERVWDWVHKYGDTIDRQHQRLGASCDWSRLRFTLDPGPSRAVRTTFVNLYQKGLIYRHERIINWCPRCSTALSDLEVDYQEQDGKLYHIRYPLEGEPGAHITVATTRPETMLGDTGVAVHPDDPRHKHLVGQRAVLPIVGRSIPIVGDTAIEQEFGTGALKVTPGHDPVDFDIGQRHQLEIVNIIGFDGNMTEAAGKYAGVERFAAREAVAAELESLGLLEKADSYRHSVGHCQRCGTVVEPLISLQWFVKVGRHDQPDSIAGRAHAAVAEGRITIVPDRFTRVYLNWLENIRDWCISRQLWWGHRIPVWYCDDCGHLTVAADDPSRCAACRSAKLTQDPDVLDTWFSSALWPHSTLGWPEATEDVGYFYPTAVLETGYDILFFWVARMIMMGLENTGEVPFRTVFLHGLIRDAAGAKMSKTRGNTMDPLALIDQYGTDALRFALTTGTAPGNDLRLGEGKLESARNFANKVWNASRFVIASLEGANNLGGWHALAAPQHREDRWILSRLDGAVAAVNRSLESFELGEAQQRLYDFIWSDFCDWYIEMAKLRLRSGVGPSPLPVLAHVLERTLRLLHPFMPFITEEVWQNLMTRLPTEGGLPESIMVAPYPQAQAGRQAPQAEGEMELVMEVVRAVRNTRAELHIPPPQFLEAVVETNGVHEAIQQEADVIRSLSRVDPLHIRAGGGGSPDRRRGITLVVKPLRQAQGRPLVVRLPLEGVVDLAAEEKRLRQELEGCRKNLARVEALVGKADFRAKAKPEVVEREEERLRSLGEQQGRLEEILAQLAG
ncbi:MAG: valine--tRNA ligase [Dehalococcoidia bacterium]|nr:valine--tRNA ligase [Dehalococcoidia bacterium]MSQ17927.1 valine--tRNA ligase [Dehalococcoidia bacterium]